MLSTAKLVFNVRLRDMRRNDCAAGVCCWSRSLSGNMMRRTMCVRAGTQTSLLINSRIRQSVAEVGLSVLRRLLPIGKWHPGVAVFTAPHASWSRKSQACVCRDHAIYTLHADETSTCAASLLMIITFSPVILADLEMREN